MIARPIFELPDVEFAIESIRRPNSVFTIRSYDRDTLTLECDNGDSHYSFYMHYTADLASGLNRQVEYRGGMILFTDVFEYGFDSESESEDFFMTMDIQETDYTVPMVEDIEECPVCYEPYEPMYGSLCGHHTCVECMKRMDAQGLHKCPMCRSDDFKFPIAVACNRMFVRS